MASSFGFFALFFVGLFLPSILGLECYSCGWRYAPGRDDPGCVDFDPTMVGRTDVTGAPQILPCPAGKICTVKNHYQKSTDITWDFLRSCIDIGHPESTQGCTDSAEYYTCITTCNTDRCNTGNGIPPGGGNGASAVTATLTSLALLSTAFILWF